MIKKLLLLVVLFLAFVAYIGSRGPTHVPVASTTPPKPAPSLSRSAVDVAATNTATPSQSPPAQTVTTSTSTAAVTSAPQANAASTMPKSATQTPGEQAAAAIAARFGSRPRGITLEKYMSVREGMTYDQVYAVLMEHGTEHSSSQFGDVRTVLMSWSGPALGNMNVTFQNGRVVSKAQFGLRSDPADRVVDLDAELESLAAAQSTAERERAATEAEERKRQHAADMRRSIEASREGKPVYQSRTWKLKNGSVVARLKSFGAGKLKLETAAGELLELIESDVDAADLQFVRDGVR